MKKLTIKDYLILGTQRSCYWDDLVLPKNSKTKSWWKCKKCGHRWLAHFNHIQRLVGCPKCKSILLSKIHKGKKLSKEVKQKMSVSAKNKPPMSQETKQKISKSCKGLNAGKNNGMYGTIMSKETKQKISKSLKGKKNAWNPNLTDEDRQDRRLIPEYIEWRYGVFKRNNYTCEICGQVGGKLNAHHKNGYANNPEQRTLLENGVCFCETCHKNFHHQYGYNNTKEQFLEFKEKYSGSC